MKMLPLRLLLVFCFLCEFTSFAQQQPTLETYFNDTYFYKLDAKQSLEIFAHNAKAPDSSIFTKPVYVQHSGSDSLPLQQGNYVKIVFNSNILRYEYVPITPWRIYILENGKNLIIQLLDLKTAKPRSVTNVSYGKTKMVFDNRTGSYVLHKFKHNDKLSIVDKNETFYFNINKKWSTPNTLKTRLNKILFASPTFYATTLYRLYNRCLIDGAFWVIHGYDYSSSFNQMAISLEGLRLKFKKQREDKEYHSYFYFSKPKYKEGDTIKFKAHLLDDYKKGIWHDKPVLVFLDKGREDIYLGKAFSKRKGAGYDFQFVIQDSMDVDIDDDYSIVLKDLDSNKLGSDKFTYEDYELKKAVFAINLNDGKNQIKDKPFGIHFTAKDENDLPMPDTRVSITVEANKVYNVQPNRLFVPDTLWTFNTTIKNGEDTILIPDSIFPAANVDYSLEVAMQNSENERTDLSEDIEYHLTYNELKMELQNDGISITQTTDNHKKVHITADDRFDITLVDTMVNTPCTLPLNTHVQKYYCETDDDDVDLNIDNFEGDVSVHANRTKDSVFFSLTNSRNLSVVYYLFDGKKQIKRGTQSDFPFAIAADDKKTYYIKAEYIWAGKTAFDNTFIPLFKNNIHFNIERPSVITPGKEVDIHITATDYKNNPIKDLNLLSYAYTQKFGETDITQLPFQDYINKSTTSRNPFDFDYSNDGQQTSLRFPFWNAKMMLDTNWAYAFRYPGPYKTKFTEVKVADSITQMAPFVMDNGAIQPIQYVYIDNVPVYFGFTDNRAAYSFEVDTNYHQVEIRTSKKLIIMDSIKVKPYVKSLFSIDQSNLNVAISATSMPDTFTTEERYKLSLCVMNLDMPASALRYAFLERAQDNGQFFDLSQNAGYRYSNERTVGPVYWRYWNFSQYNAIHRGFEYEPEYTYTFTADVVKMKSNIARNLVPRSYTNYVPSVNDEVLTKKQLFEDFEEALFQERRNTTPILEKPVPNGNCNLTIDYDSTLLKFKPLNIIVGRPNDFNFISIYPGSSTGFGNLAPGQYQLLLIDRYNSYRQTGIIDVKENGTNFYRITKADTIKEANFKAINDALVHLYQSNNETAKGKNLSVLMNNYTKGTYKGAIKTYTGKVLDDQQEGIPGVTIKIIGTNIGTMTDVDGNYEIEIPMDVNAMLSISALGFEKQEVRAHNNMRIIMVNGGNVLTECTVTQPYGPAITKQKYVGAADVITARSIEKMPVSDLTAAIEGASPGVVAQPGSSAGLMIRGTGPLSENNGPLFVIDGAIYNGDITSLDPSLVASMTILKDATSTSLYGSRGSNGVIVITTKKGAVLPDKIKAGLQTPPPPMTDDMMVSSLRNNFRDDAYWQPDLVTDENGKVSFKVKFPDDITNWRTFLFATDNQKHTGAVMGNIKSYKPVAASLYLPHFLLTGDTAMLIGKSVNYIPDTIAATTTFFKNDSLQKENKIKLGSFYNDTLMVTATKGDSLKLKYLLTKEDGYFDGEEKNIPLHPVGVKVAEGAFMSLDMKDTSFVIYPTNKTDTLHINATASLMDVMMDEVNELRYYGYLCNEQMASKIIAMLTKERVYQLLHKDIDPKDKAYVQDLVRKLSKNQNNNYLWGWWDNGTTVHWISTHVMHALMKAKEMGYNSNVDFKPITDAYIFDLERDTMHTNIAMLQTLSDNKLVLNYEKYISRLERQKNLSLNDYFELVLLRQKLHLPYKTERLKNLQESDIYGNIYWKDTARYVYQNETITTINALKIIGQDSTIGINKNKIVNWLIQQRGNRGWRNTYESAQIIEAIAPLIPLGDSAAMKPSIHLGGGMEDEVTEFPYRKNVMLHAPVQIHKKGATPVYFTYYYNKWDTTNVNLGHAFKVQSSFKANGKNVNYLPAGQPVTMNVNVQADKSADFIMIEIPIPAGCSYREKNQSYTNYEIHREYFEDKVSIFCEKLPKGNYNFEVELLPRYQGNYTLNPAKAELMYFPVFYGRDLMKKVEIKE